MHSHILNKSFETGNIAELWGSSALIPIPKKGDPADVNNYRGISLMATILKVLTIIISDRLNSAMENLGLFSITQAGFHRKEECVTQAACVIEILQRRKLLGERTLAIFVDFKKAYDLVPHGALFAKLGKLGIRGKCLGFLEGLYAKSSFVVRLGVGETAMYSEPCQLLKGLRQGCPLSPVLFNIFINDIFEEAERFNATGVMVPHSSPGMCRGKKQVVGALFADDLVTLSDNVESVAACCQLVTTWAERNEMRVGIAKCGILEVLPGEDESILWENLDPRRGLRIQGDLVPVMTEYTYLGLNLTSELTVKSLAETRVKLGKRKVAQILPFLSCPVLPLAMRLRVFQAVILPTLLFGAEVFGMNRDITKSMQVLASRCYCTMLGLKSKTICPVPSVALWLECRQKPICTLAAGYRARAMCKGRTLKTQLKFLVDHPYRVPKWTWVTGTTRWFNRYCRSYALENSQTVPYQAPYEEGSHKGTQTCVHEAIVLREMQIRMDRTRYTGWETLGYMTGRPFAGRSVFHTRVGASPLQVNHLKWIVRFRLRAVTTCQLLAGKEVGKLPTWFTKFCPFCKRGVPETVYHMVFLCKKWTDIRKEYLGDIRGELKKVHREILKDPEVDADLFLMPKCVRLNIVLGGTYYKRGLANWFPPSLEKLEEDEEEDSLESDPSQTTEDLVGDETIGDDPTITSVKEQNYLCYKVGKFLEELMRR